VYGFASMLFNEKISSFLENGQVPPRELPTVISSRSEDVAVYEDLLRKIGMFPLDLRNIRPFPTIQIRGQKTPTIAAIEIHGIEILNTGMVLHFTLEKGEYATTFLSHIFNLANGNPSEDISVESCDIQAAISNSNGSQIAKTAALDYFKKTIDSMTETEG
jgi:tRNA(Glu) U13 pseudouridine synthase TruD